MRRLQYYSPVVAVVFLLFCCTAVLSTKKPYPDGHGNWARIKNVDGDWHVVGMAEFAVSEHNKQTGENLKYVRIIRAQVNGTRYRLIIRADDVAGKHRYEAVVWEILWDKIRQLISFKLMA